MQAIRIVEIPDCKMVSSGVGMFGEENFTAFNAWRCAVHTDIDQQTDIEAMDKELHAFLQEHGFAQDTSRRRMGNIITPPQAAEILGYHQMDYYMPINAIS